MKLHSLLAEISMPVAKQKLPNDTKSRADKVHIRLTMKDKENRRWKFKARTDDGSYVVTFHSKEPESATKQQLKNTNVEYSCTCPAFLYWGSDYWASKGDYLDLRKPGYRYPRSKGKVPNIRDPHHKNLMCKHVLAVYNDWKNVIFP